MGLGFLDYLIDPFDFTGMREQDAQKAQNASSIAQAQKTMDFQERMSSTAYQRQVQDMLKAGLNPILSANAGGASTPSGATAPIVAEDASAKAMHALPGKVLGAMSGGIGLAATAAQVATSKKSLDVMDSQVGLNQAQQAANMAAAANSTASAQKTVAQIPQEAEKSRVAKVVEGAASSAAQAQQKQSEMQKSPAGTWLDYILNRVGLNFGVLHTK